MESEIERRSAECRERIRHLDMENESDEMLATTRTVSWDQVEGIRKHMLDARTPNEACKAHVRRLRHDGTLGL